MATGALTSFGNISGLVWQDEGHLLALTIDADRQIGNSVSVFDPGSGRLRSLDADGATYRGLSWREESADLAVLKTYEDEAYEDTAHVALAWRDLDDDRPAKYDKYDGDLISFRAAAEWRPWKRFGIGVAYQYVDINVDVEKTSKTERYEVELYGPVLFLSVGL